ncbi:MAG: glycosyltransferase family 4 protein [Spirochaetales bacterium]|nr:glycosyltransferase family 4 protein [Spirochaetales bacterium]
MNILYIFQYFGTPSYAGGIRAYKFAKYWQAQGHRVTILTSKTQINPEYLVNVKGRLFSRLVIEDLDVVVCNFKYQQSMSFMQRMVSFCIFALLCSLYILFHGRYNVIYATSTPLTVGLPALVGKICKNIPYVFEVRDQWPMVPIEMGVLKNKFIIKILLKFEKKIYKKAGALIVLSPGMYSGVKKVCRDSKKLISIIPNSSDTDLFNPGVSGERMRKKYNWGKKTVFLYAGSLGWIHNVDFIVEAADKVKNNPDIHFAIIGHGSEQENIALKIKKLKLSNIDFIGAVPKAELPEYLAACDVSLSTITNIPVIEHNSANKFFDALAAGNPILLNYSGWHRDIIEKNDIGYGCRLCDLKEYVNKIIVMHKNKKRLNAMGKNARELAENEFARDKLALQALTVVEGVVKN